MQLRSFLLSVSASGNNYLLGCTKALKLGKIAANHSKVTSHISLAFQSHLSADQFILADSLIIHEEGDRERKRDPYREESLEM